MDERKDLVYKIFRVLRENAVKIIMAIREKEKIRWKELQEITKISTATFNRALATLQEINFIRKEKNFYTLTWTGKLVADGLLLLGWRLAEESEEGKEELGDFIAEELLAKDIVMAIIFLLFISLKRRRKLNVDAFEKEIKREMKVIRRIMKEYEKDGYIEIKNGWVVAKEKLDELDINKIFG